MVTEPLPANPGMGEMMVHSLAGEEPLKGEGSGHPHGEAQGVGCFGIKSDEFGMSEHGPPPLSTRRDT